MIDLSVLDELCASGKNCLSTGTRIAVGLGTCGRAAGAQAVYDEFAARLDAKTDSDATDTNPEGANSITLDGVGCRGLCSYEPLVEVYLPNGDHRAYGNVGKEDVSSILEYIKVVSDSAQSNRAVESDSDGETPNVLPVEDIFKMQERRVLQNCGYINPGCLEEYVACGGYRVFANALKSGDPESIISEIETSGLRGRGGAGYPTGAKWRSCAQASSKERYFIVNGDEGDPGAYMDRALLESDPHRVLEGLMLGCLACDVHKAYFFIRAEYPQAVSSVKHAIACAYDVGLLGKDILGSDFSLDVSVVRGAGSFLCGESTAMVNVLEGKRCTTRKKPPHMTEKGLWSKPTCINNVETLANVPLILQYGAKWFRGVGTPDSPGTKILSITGSVERTGLVEIPFGAPIDSIARDIAGASNPKAVQIGGPSGAILPVDDTDLSISYESLGNVGAMVGSGGLVVLSEEQCVVDTVAYLVRFSLRQSCGRCRACREGLTEAIELLDKICAGEASEDDLALLEKIARETCADKSLCGLGGMALNPVLTSLDYFKDEYNAHLQGRCPGLVCKKLISYVIDQQRCQGERCCLTMCPGNAIKGAFGKPGRIVERLCQKCGSCMEACCYGAVKKVTGKQGD